MLDHEKKKTDQDEKEREQNLREGLLKGGSAATLKMYQSLLMRIRSGEQLKPSEYRLLKDLEHEIEDREEDDDSKIRGMTEAAQYCLVSKQGLAYNLGRGNLKQNPDGSFDREELDRYLATRGRRKEDREFAQKRLKADLRFKIAKAEKEEILVRRLRGELSHIDDIVAVWADRVSEVVSALEALVHRLPPLLSGKDLQEVNKIISEEVWQVFTVYARAGKFCPTLPNK